MLPENKNAFIYRTGGAIGGGVARAFARNGARVFLADSIVVAKAASVPRLGSAS